MTIGKNMPTKKILYLKYSILGIFMAIMSVFLHNHGIEYLETMAHNEMVKYQQVSKEMVLKERQEQTQRKSIEKDEPREGAETKIEVAGVINFELSEKTSWITVAKILITVLGTWFGIKAINHIFRRWEIA